MTRLILAPLRGYTDVVFRNTYQRHFQGVDEAVAPFVTSTFGRRIKATHLRDLEPAQNRSLPVVPQILGNDSDAFIRLANALIDMGYPEINWNLGCPYPMVAKKYRGSGLLPHPDRIDRLLETMHEGVRGRISVKTRLGRRSTSEMSSLIPIFNRYPLARVIIHPRTGVQMYDGDVDLDAFAVCLSRIRHPIVYNGDIRDRITVKQLEARFPKVAGWMIGRGLIADPFLPECIRRDGAEPADRGTRFRQFHDDLVEGYGRIFCGPAHVLDRMKGFWRYFAEGFQGGARLLKQIRKAGSLQRYQLLVSDFLDLIG